MAVNPMQRKMKISFILGMLLMLVIAGLIIAFLYTQIIQKQKLELDQYKKSTSMVYVLNQDVKSGQVLTTGMFTQKQVTNAAIPTRATSDVATTLSSASLSTKDGIAIYYHPATPGNAEDVSYYYLMINKDKESVEKRIYITNQNGEQVLASNLKASDKAYYYDGEENTSAKKNIEIAQNAVVAKVDLDANTVLTNAFIVRSDEISTKDLRKEEYNIISLPVDLAPGEYIDVRLMLPNGQNYIVVSKKKVSIPVVNGQYVSDTIQMKLTEEEIMIMSSAIVENYKTTGSKLYATRYVEPGMQDKMIMTYYPNSSVQAALQNEIQSDSELVLKAINGIRERRNEVRKNIDSSISANSAEDDSIASNTEKSITSTLEKRKNYLQTLPVTQ